jgi:hypothetical protein
MPDLKKIEIKRRILEGNEKFQKRKFPCDLQKVRERGSQLII